MRREDFETSFVVGQSLRVLSVDDSPASADRCHAALRRHGYAVSGERITTTEECQQVLAATVPDVVLFDPSLPGWSAAELLELLRRKQREIPCIVLVETVDEAAVAQLIDLGVDDYVVKGRLERLPLAVRRVMREQRLFSELRAAGREREQLIAQLEETLAEVKRLNGLLPVCVTCKRILNAQGFWNRMEHYIERYSEAQVSPSLCPDCAAHLFPEQAN